VWTEFLCPKCGKNLKLRNFILRKTIHYLRGMLAGTTQQNLKCRKILNQEILMLMFMDLCIIVQLIKKNPTRCNNVSKFYYSIFIWTSTCFGRHTTHHQEPRTALAASGLKKKPEGASAVLCSWWWVVYSPKYVEHHINME